MPAVSGTVKDANGNFARRLVRVHRRDTGALVGETLSSPSTGAWSVTTADYSKHYAVAHDSDAWITYLPMNGDTGSTSFPEWGGKTVTAAGNAQISTAQSKFGGASAYFDGNGDYLTLPANTNFDIFSGDFTVECFTYFASTANAPHIVNIGSAATNRFTVWLNGSVLTVFVNNGAPNANILTGPSVITGVWYHIAVTKSGGTWRLFVDGTQVSTSTSTIIPSGNLSACVGFQNFGGFAGDYFNGCIDDLLISKGVARYIANFTPPTAPHFTPQDGDPWWGNVVLGCHFNTGETPTFKDVAAGKTITAVGNAAISTAQSKFGGASAYFDGNGDYLSAASNDFAFGTDSITIEFWFYTSATAGQAGVLTTAPQNANAPYGLAVTVMDNSFIYAQYGWDTHGYKWDVGAFANGWHHVAICRTSGANGLSLFFDGVLKTPIQTGNGVASSISFTTTALSIGANFTGGNTTNQYAGYIDDLRITKGVARYSANFTPPATAFPEQLLTFGQKNAMIYDFLTPV